MTSLTSLSLINKLLSQPAGYTRHLEQLTVLFTSFITEFSNPLQINITSTTTATQATVTDIEKIDPFVSLLSTLKEDNVNPQLEVLIAKSIKILLRKPINRASMGKLGK